MRTLGASSKSASSSVIDFEFIRGPEGVDVVIRPQDNSWGPAYLRAGVSITDDFEGHNSFAVLLNVTRTSPTALGAEWHVNCSWGAAGGCIPSGAAAGFCRPLVPSPPAASMDGRSAMSTISIRNCRVQRRIRHRQPGLRLPVRRIRRVQAGPAARRCQCACLGRIVRPALLDAELAGVTSRLVIDRLDNVGVPRDGTCCSVEAFRSEPGLGADERYSKLAGDTGYSAPWAGTPCS